MAESYDELKQENEHIKQEREKDRKIVIALKEQIDKLKLIIQVRSNDDEDEKSEVIQSLRQENERLKTCTAEEVHSLRE